MFNCLFDLFLWCDYDNSNFNWNKKLVVGNFVLLLGGVFNKNFVKFLRVEVFISFFIKNFLVLYSFF